MEPGRSYGRSNLSSVDRSSPLVNALSLHEISSSGLMRETCLLLLGPKCQDTDFSRLTLYETFPRPCGDSRFHGAVRSAATSVSLAVWLFL